MSTPPKKISTGDRDVTQYAVPDAGDRAVEREQQNRINKRLQARVEEIEENGGGGGSRGVTDHGELTGLDEDDHLHYHTNYRAFVWFEGAVEEQAGTDWVFDAAEPSIELYVLTAVGTATEALTAGRFVNVDTAGEVQHADSSTTEKMADGFVLSSYSNGATNVRVYYGGENNQVSGLTPGDIYYLDTSGQVTDTPPIGSSPVFVQQLGRALTATRLLVNIQQAIERPE